MGWEIKIKYFSSVLVKGRYKIRDIESPIFNGEILRNIITLDLISISIDGILYPFEELCINTGQFIQRYEDQINKKVREDYNQ